MTKYRVVWDAPVMEIEANDEDEAELEAYDWIATWHHRIAKIKEV